MNQGTPGGNCSGACAVNLPDGNVGTFTRHGPTLSWSGDRGLLDEAGDDFVVYESASSSTGDEGFMVRLGDPEGAFSDWRFETFDVFESYTGGASGAMATAFDIASFNFQSSGPVSIIQIANLINADTLSQSGVVLFDGSGASHGFSSGALDPDPLYLGAISALGSTATTVPHPAGLPLLIAALGAIGLLRRRRT